MHTELENLGLRTRQYEAARTQNDKQFRIAFNEFSKRAQDLAVKLDKVRGEVDRKPSEAQKETGNYKKGHLSWNGLQLTIENPKGSTRSGVDGDGKSWSIKMKYDYGYFKGTKGKDGDHVDVFIGPEPDSELVFVINQVIGGEFDEHKSVIGAINEAQAREVYLANYEDGWQGLGSVKPMTLADFKVWVTDHKKTKKQAAHERRGECPGCGKPFPDGEPYDDVDMCETCERFGPPKTES